MLFCFAIGRLTDAVFFVPYSNGLHVVMLSRSLYTASLAIQHCAYLQSVR